MPIKAPSFPPYQLLGLPPDADEIRQFIQKIAPAVEGQEKSIPEPTIKRFPDCTYHSFYNLGISLCFVPKSKTASNDGNDLRLDSIDIYNGQTRDGFQPYTGKEYPFGFGPTTQAHEIVSQLGEPDRKGGGGKTHLPCWIEYYFKDKAGNKKGGIMIQLHGVDWEDREMGWTSLVLY